MVMCRTLLCFSAPASCAPGAPRFVVLGLAHGTSFATEEHGPKSAIAARDALVSHWRQRACPSARYLEALDAAPPMIKSDNTASAVKVAQETGARASSRCAVHVFQIPVRRVCFVRDADPRARPPRPVGDADAAPVLLKALEPCSWFCTIFLHPFLDRIDVASSSIRRTQHLLVASLARCH